MFPLGHPPLVKSINHANTNTATAWLARSRSFEETERPFQLAHLCGRNGDACKENKAMIKEKSGGSRCVYLEPVRTPRLMYLQISLTAQISANAFQLPVLMNSFHKQKRQSLMFFSLSEGPCWNEITATGVGGFCLQGVWVREGGRYKEKDIDAKGRRTQSHRRTAPSDWTRPFVSGQDDDSLRIQFYYTFTIKRHPPPPTTNGFTPTSRRLHLPETNPETLHIPPS